MQTEDLVTLKCGRSTAKVHLFGATVVSWEVEDQELLFVSKQSLFDNKKAIRGGIPFVFPQFGPWTVGPQHGFARISKWSLSDTSQNNNEKATFILEANEATKAIWNHSFKIEYTVTLKEKQILMDVGIQNQGEEEFSFTLLLHTYFSVPDVSQCEVTGLKGCSYIDKVKGGSIFTESKERVKVAEFTDRIYKNTPLEHTLVNVAGSRSIGIKKTNFPDTVLWNPWEENAKSMSDFGNEEWHNMICVEAGEVAEPVVLAPQQSFHAAQTLSLLDSARL